MTGRLRRVGLFASLIMGALLAFSLVLVASAESRPGKPDRPERGIARVQILTFNDFHGWMESPRSVGGRPVGGAEYLAAYLDRYAKMNKEGTIRVHDGDSVGGSPLISSYFHDEPAVYAMNEMDLDLGTLGNHEFDEGGRELRRLLNGGQRNDGKQFKDGPDGTPINTSTPNFPGARFPYVSANSVFAGTQKPIIRPYKVIERKGQKIGFIGINTPETETIVVPDAVAPFDFLDISTTVNRYVKQLKKRDVETIVVLAHSGGTVSGDAVTGEIATETAQMNDEVDVVISGHSHTEIDARIDGKLVVQAGSFGGAIGVVRMGINRRTDDVKAANAQIVTTFQDGVKPDARVARITQRYKNIIAPISNRVVGTAAEPVTRTNNAAGESPLGQLIADAQREFAGTDFAFMNPGGIRANIEAGEVTYGELFAVQPFDNQVVRMELTGEQIYALLEQQFQTDSSGNPRTRILQVSGLRFTYNSANAAGSRITSVTLPDGTTPIDRSATYTVAANSFIATGGDGFTVLKEGRNPTTLGSDLDALEQHIDENLPDPFPAPDPNASPRITKEG